MYNTCMKKMAQKYVQKRLTQFIICKL